MLLDIPKIGEKTVKILNSLGIFTKDDLINYYPYKHNILEFNDIEELGDGDRIVAVAKVTSTAIVNRYGYKANSMKFSVIIKDYELQAIIYNRAFLKDQIIIGNDITIIGKFNKSQNKIIVSDIKLSITESTNNIDPVYHITSGITSTKLNLIINEVLNEDFEVIDYVPDYINEMYNFIDKKTAIKEIHNPSSINSLKRALMKLKYEEIFLFMIKVSSIKYKHENITKVNTKKIDEVKVYNFIDKLSFSLTPDQLTSVKEIISDLSDDKQMNRIVIGDVGSGKTIVAFISIYANFLANYQSAFMAPTEILAKQHFENSKKLFNDELKIELLTGSTSKKEKDRIYEEVKSGNVDLLIGTHSLIQDKLEFDNLGLVITDEQHRFGVNQRKNLRTKADAPDILYMSATPIPRTYALTVYGDMDISTIKTLPSGRKDVATFVKTYNEINEVLKLMYIEFKNKHQIFVVAPLVNESDRINLENVNDLKTKLTKAFKNLMKIDVIHGKLKNDEKDKVMTMFKNHEIDLLISTTVIEVGVDIKNATMIVVYDADRFGLSQLHQLRGRVGRNDFSCSCILISDKSVDRLRILEENKDGFSISEEDFKLRGFGNLFGDEQSGETTFKIADFKTDYKIVLQAKKDSEEFLSRNDKDEYLYLNNIIDDILNLD